MTYNVFGGTLNLAQPTMHTLYQTVISRNKSEDIIMVHAEIGR